jgi:hypothetical protein
MVDYKSLSIGESTPVIVCWSGKAEAHQRSEAC